MDSRAAAVVAGTPRDISMWSTMSTSLVGRTTPMPRLMACSWVISPPIRVHWSVGRTRESSSTLGHGWGQPPTAACTRMVGRARRGSATEPNQGLVEGFECDSAFAGVEGLCRVEGGQHRDLSAVGDGRDGVEVEVGGPQGVPAAGVLDERVAHHCLLYTSDAADDLLCVDLGGRRIIKKKKN